MLGKACNLSGKTGEFDFRAALGGSNGKGVLETPDCAAIICHARQCENLKQRIIIKSIQSSFVGTLESKFNTSLMLRYKKHECKSKKLYL